MEIEPKSLKTLAEATETLSVSDWEVIELPQHLKAQTVSAEAEQGPKLRNNGAEAEEPGQPYAVAFENDTIKAREMDKHRLIAMIHLQTKAYVEARDINAAKEQKLQNEVTCLKGKLERIEAYLYDNEFAKKK
ncbi:hypothetical protein CPLU01_12886 [Colletotrichum plurivorum]|uniref:Uncharacterized protein n=1 Tax=Colletotrichum plurivorum TaxID=2175906 RepID=A0A8H6JWL3_9PEZI|nr:hypothetical protein CPLU01_12886 [Colletotrichum plurivorum]